RNLLFLDEPTNHLDIPAAEILEEALVGFDGTVILISHDRRFLETVTTRTVSFNEDGVDIYEGGFKDYIAALDRKAQHDLELRERERLRQRESEAQRANNPPSDAARGQGADVHRARRAKARDLEKKQRRVADLEIEIKEREAEVQRHRIELRDASGE